MGKDRFNSQPQHASESTIGFLLDLQQKKQLRMFPKIRSASEIKVWERT
jgi:hypothetical protein